MTELSRLGRSRVLLGLTTALLVACSGGSAASTPPSPPPPVATASATATAADSKTRPTTVPTTAPTASRAADIVVGGDRPVTVHVPPGYDPSRPAPLLIGLHGYASNGQEHASYFHIDDAAAQRGYLYAWPNGTLDSQQNRFWNATDACCDHEGSGVDDAAYLETLIKEIEGKFNVDPKRIDLIGHSNGAFMSYAMACKDADTIAAIVSLAGATYADPKDCAPTTPVAVLEIHGTADDTILYTGGTIGLGGGHSMAPYPGAETSVTTWATYDGCTSRTDVDEHVDVDAALGTATDPAEATVMRWVGCRPGGAAELWTIPGGGHGPKLSDAFPGAVLDFFEAHPKP